MVIAVEELSADGGVAGGAGVARSADVGILKF